MTTGYEAQYYRDMSQGVKELGRIADALERLANNGEKDLTMAAELMERTKGRVDGSRASD